MPILPGLWFRRWNHHKPALPWAQARADYTSHGLSENEPESREHMELNRLNAAIERLGVQSFLAGVFSEIREA